MNLMDLVVNISANSSDMERKIQSAVTFAQNSIGKLSQLYNKVANSFAVKLVVEGAQINSTLAGYQASFSAFLHDSEAGAKTMQEIVQMSLNSALDTTTLAQATQTLLEAGMDAEATKTAIQQLGDISGGSAPKLLELASAFAECESSGHVTESALVAMQRQGFDPLTEIANRNHLSIESAMQAIRDGVVPVSELKAAMSAATSESGQYFNALEGSTENVQGKWSQIQNSLDSLKSVIAQDFDQSITKKGIIWLLDKVAAAIKDVTEWAANWELYVDIGAIWESIKGFFTDAFDWTAGALHDALDWVKSGITGIGGWISDAKQTISDFFSNFSVAYESSPIKTAVDAVTGAVGAIISAAESAIAKLKELFGLQGEEAALPVAERTSSGQITPTGALQIMSGNAHATGLYEVPYDGYAAILHRGERVLTKAQADESRSKKDSRSQNDNYTINIQSTAESPSETAMYIKQALRSLRFGV